MEYLMEQTYTSFKRYCKTLTLKDDPALIEAYRKIHRPGEAWPEIARGMKEVGILDMEIYITGNRLFMIMDTIPDFNHERAMEKLASKPGQSEWEAHVAQFQDTTREASAEEKWKLIERIYKLGE